MAYQSRTNEYGPQIIAIAKQVRADYPQDWSNAHNHHPSGNVYIRRVAWAVHQALPALGVGLNGKRGNPNDMSQDILAFKNDTGCKNAAPGGGGLELRDIIVNAGAPNADLHYGDVTQATINQNESGYFIEPAPVDGTQPGPTPPVSTLKPRDQFGREFMQTNDFYAAQEGLQRVGGMVSGVDASVFNVLKGVAGGSVTDMTAIQNAARDVLKLQCDVQSMNQWGYDLMAGASVDAVIKQIRQSDEWKAKHPGETP